VRRAHEARLSFSCRITAGAGRGLSGGPEFPRYETGNSSFFVHIALQT